MKESENKKKKEEGEEMACLSEGGKSPSPRGVLKILVFDLQISVRGGLKKRCPRGVRKIPVFSHGVEKKSQFCSRARGSRRFSSPPPVFLMEYSRNYSIM